MAIQPGTIAEVIYRYTVNNQICMSVLHYVYTNGATVADNITATSGLLAKIDNPLTNQLAIRLAACQASNVSYLDVSAQVIWPTRYLKFKSAFALTGTGLAFNTAQNLAAVITKQTQFASRSGVGSLHIGGLSPTDYSAGLVDPGLKTRMDFLGTEMLADINDAVNGIVWHPCLANKTPIVGTDPVKFEVSGSTLLYTFVVQPELRVMRRRTVGLGI